MNDFKSMYYELLGKMQLCDPTHPAVDKGLSDKQKVIYNAWRNGRDVTNRDYRTLKEIRDRTGYNLFRPSSPQMMFDTKIPYLRMEQLKNPANDYEKILWEEYKRVYGNPFER